MLADAVVFDVNAAYGTLPTPTAFPTTTVTPLPPDYFSARDCSIVLSAIADLEAGDTSKQDAVERMKEGPLFLDRVEPAVKETDGILARAIVTTPNRAGVALLPFEEIYPKGVTFRDSCETLGHW